MEYLIDSSLWIDFTRRKSSSALKSQIWPWVTRAESFICEPVVFEVLRNAARGERRSLNAHFNVMSLLPVPASLWQDALRLGQSCRDRGFSIASLDLLIAAVALHHGAEVVTFDSDYSLMGQVSALQVRLLSRAS